MNFYEYSHTFSGLNSRKTYWKVLMIVELLALLWNMLKFTLSLLLLCVSIQFCHNTNIRKSLFEIEESEVSSATTTSSTSIKISQPPRVSTQKKRNPWRNVKRVHILNTSRPSQDQSFNLFNMIRNFLQQTIGGIIIRFL